MLFESIAYADDTKSLLGGTYKVLQLVGESIDDVEGVLLVLLSVHFIQTVVVVVFRVIEEVFIEETRPFIGVEGGQGKYTRHKLPMDYFPFLVQFYFIARLTTRFNVPYTLPS